LGQPFFPGARSEVEGGGISDGISDGLSSASGVGVGLAFFRFDLLFGVAVGVGVGEAFFRFEEADGDGVGVGFFVECFRYLRDGVGLGSGSRTLLILVPNDSSEVFATWTVPNNIAAKRNNRSGLWKSINIVGRLCETPPNPASDTDALQFAPRLPIG
jgi:hypothetical protein